MHQAGRRGSAGSGAGEDSTGDRRGSLAGGGFGERGGGILPARGAEPGADLDRRALGHQHAGDIALRECAWDAAGGDDGA